MRTRNLPCPECGARLCLDNGLWEIGTVRVRCVSCGLYFLPEGSPRTRTPESVANASVALELWEPADARGVTGE